MEHFTPAPPAAVTRVLSTFDRQSLEGFIAVAIDLLDLAQGDVEAEGDPFNEDEPAFDPASREMVNVHGHGPGDPISGDAEPSAWTERVDQSRGGGSRFIPSPLGSDEDAEEDDPQGEVTDDDPAFTKRDRVIANGSAVGPGCWISDPDAGSNAEDEVPNCVFGDGGPGCPFSDPGGDRLTC